MTPPSPLRWRLRDATSDLHARLDARVAPALDDAAGYAAFLTGMHALLAAAADVTGDAPLATARRALAADLADLGHAPPAHAPRTRGAASTAAGWRYVVAGASLGAHVLRPRAQALGFDAGFGARYLALQCGSRAWREVLAQLDDPALDAEAAIAGARAAFACAEAAMAGAFDAMAA